VTGHGQPKGVATATSVARLDQARRNEDLVLAENALDAVRFVFVIRILVVLWLGITAMVGARLTGSEFPDDRTRMVVIAAYLVSSVVALISVRRSTPDVREALRKPFLSIAMDFAFVALMAWQDAATGGFSESKLAAVCGLYTSFSLSYFSLWHVAVSGAVAIAVFLTGVMAAGVPPDGRTLLMVPGALAALAFLIGWANWRTRRMFVNLRRRDNLTRFLPRPVAERILAEGESRLAPIQREVTVLFTDIRDFTALSENMAPGALLAFLDDYLGHMSQIVKGHDGVVNKFLGDGMLAFWGVPDEDPRHAEKGMAAALSMRAKLGEINAARAEDGLAAIRIGIGIHTGLVAAGMLGSADQHEYTIIGDAVNVASRVEGLTRRFDTDILVTESTWGLAPDEAFAGRRLASEVVKCRVEPVVVYALDR
jgi:adenylate cyclase